MKKLFLTMAATAAVLLIAGTSYSQNAGELDWLNLMDKKAVAVYADAVNLFIYQLGKTPTTFEQDSAILESEGIALTNYTNENVLTKGMLSKMTAKYLNLKGSLMYSLFGTERYAYKACIANGIFTEDGSEMGTLSGPAMIEVFAKINEIKGGQK